MKVSIIIPVYNVEKYLSKCVDSVLNQTHADLEVILVDDGSPDNCGIICDKYAEKDSRVKVIHKKNGGLSDARNAGLDIFTGEYVFFLDSDDIIHPQYTELMFQKIGNRDMLVAEFLHFYDGDSLPLDKLDFSLIEVDSYTAKDLMSQLIKNTNLIISCNKLYKCSLWESIRFPIGVLHEDEFITHEILDECKEVGFLPSKIYFYRLRENSIMSASSDAKSRIDKLTAFWHRHTFFLEKGMKAEAKTLRNEILSYCLYSFVRKDNSAWRNITLKMIFFENDLSLKNKLILFLKKICYPLYKLLYKYR